MADFDIDSVTRVLGREPDQEINGLHYEAVDRAAEASELSSEELRRLADTPEIHDLVNQRREALSMNQVTVDRFQRYTAGKPLPLEAPPAPAATREPAASVGRDMAADRGAPRVGPAPATSVPSPGGAPRVGGHVQGRSHEQVPSVDR